MDGKNTKNKVLYITFVDFNAESGSGSAVRPKRMYDAFIESGYEVKLLSGVMNNRKVRQEGVRQIMEYLMNNTPDFCYVEPATGPMFFSCDRKLIRKIKRLNIPMAYFYRDIYWKFDMSKFTNAGNLVSKVKSTIIRAMQKSEFRMLKKCVTRFYLPSETVNKYMKLDNCGVLPPACIDVSSEKIPHDNITGIYVGGATERYGMGLLLGSWMRINSNMNLIVVCPKKQWNDWCDIHPEHRNLPDNIRVYHLSDGDELNNLYKKSDFALIPILKSEYNDMAVPIKLFEYVSRNLPMVVTSCYEMQRIVQQYKVGIVAEDDIVSYTTKINEMIGFIGEKEDYFKNNIIAMKKENMWTDRVNTIANDLLY